MAQAMTPEELKQTVRDGLLSFPLTDFDADGRFDKAAYQSRIEWLGGYGAAAMFAAGGAGEFFSLTTEEYAAVIAAAVEVRGGGVPVIAAAGYGTRMAVAFAREAERLGADGLLLLPPYLTEASQEGLREHVAAVCGATRLGVIVYNRANCRLSPETLLRLADDCPNLIGFKDGVGDIEQMLTVKALAGDRIACINGMPTAEIYARAYRGMGIPTYSSAIFNFVPRSAMAFHRAVRDGDEPAVERFTRDFLIAYGRLRARQPGYAVSIIKAGAELVGRGAGRVRSPLSTPTPDEYRELGELIGRLGPQE